MNLFELKAIRYNILQEYYSNKNLMKRTNNQLIKSNLQSENKKYSNMLRIIHLCIMFSRRVPYNKVEQHRLVTEKDKNDMRIYLHEHSMLEIDYWVSGSVAEINETKRLKNEIYLLNDL